MAKLAGKLAKSLWRKIPIQGKAIIIFVLVILFGSLLLMMTCTGGTENYLEDLEKNAENSSLACYLVWENGEEQEIIDFFKSDEKRDVDTLTLIAKDTIILSKLSLGTSKLGESTNILIVAEEVVEEPEEPTEEPTCLIDTSMDAGQTVYDFSISSFTWEKGQKIVITFDKTVSLEYISVDWSYNL